MLNGLLDICMRRNFFALVMLIPVQHYIPLHQQVRPTFALSLVLPLM
jgi:hypothetical protein